MLDISFAWLKKNPYECYGVVFLCFALHFQGKTRFKYILDCNSNLNLVRYGQNQWIA